MTFKTKTFTFGNTVEIVLALFIVLTASCVCTKKIRSISNQNDMNAINEIGYQVGFTYVLKVDVLARMMASPHNRYLLRVPGSLVPPLEVFRENPNAYPDLVLVNRGTEIYILGFYYYSCKGVGPVIETKNILSNGMENVMLSAISTTDWSMGVAIPVPRHDLVTKFGSRGTEDRRTP